MKGLPIQIAILIFQESLQCGFLYRFCSVDSDKPMSFPMGSHKALTTICTVVKQFYLLRGSFVRLLSYFIVSLAVIWTFGPISASAQTGQATDYNPPLTPDGHPNIEGIWQVLNTASWGLEDRGASLGIPAGQSVVLGGGIPYLPEALAQREANFEQRATLDPVNKCYLPGVPRITYMPYPFQIVQQEGSVSILYEYLHTIRYIHMNGAPHPPGSIGWWMGDSRGHWEGNTLVVDITHFNDQTWFDGAGNYHSEELHVVERYTPTGPDHMLYQATIEDPKVFSRPWTISMPLYRRQEQHIELLEYQCHAYLLEEEWDKKDSDFFE